MSYLDNESKSSFTNLTAQNAYTIVDGLLLEIKI
jgi:hypothetical protein